MPNSIQDLSDRYVFGNDDGTFTIWKQVTTDANGNRVGPGYIGRVILRNGKRVTEGFNSPTVSVNDPRIMGFGIPGWHHYRENDAEPNIWNKGWEMKGNLLPTADPFGVSGCDIPYAPFLDANGNIRASFGVNYVDRYSSAASKRIMSVRYDYIVEASNVKMWVTFTQFPDGFDSSFAPYLKEPKLSFGTGVNLVDGYKPTTLDVFSASSALLRSIDTINDPRLQNPTQATIQVGFDTRARMRYYDGTNYMNIVARGNAPLTYDSAGKVSDYKTATREDWEGAANGLDKWASIANARAEFDPSVCGAYCKQGGGGQTGLTRQWEIAKRATEPQIQIMFHAWEGGSGLPDCLCCAKAFVAGEKHTAYFSISHDSGWVV